MYYPSALAVPTATSKKLKSNMSRLVRQRSPWRRKTCQRLSKERRRSPSRRKTWWTPLPYTHRISLPTYRLSTRYFLFLFLLEFIILYRSCTCIPTARLVISKENLNPNLPRDLLRYRLRMKRAASMEPLEQGVTMKTTKKRRSLWASSHPYPQLRVACIQVHVL